MLSWCSLRKIILITFYCNTVQQVYSSCFQPRFQALMRPLKNVWLLQELWSSGCTFQLREKSISSLSREAKAKLIGGETTQSIFGWNPASCHTHHWTAVLKSFYLQLYIRFFFLPVEDIMPPHEPSSPQPPPVLKPHSLYHCPPCSCTTVLRINIVLSTTTLCASVARCILPLCCMWVSST